MVPFDRPNFILHLSFQPLDLSFPFRPLFPITTPHIVNQQFK